MFGAKLKTWMENYIGRPKKKAQADAHKEKPDANRPGGPVLNSSESLAHSDTGISSGSQQVLSSSTNDHKEGYSTATMDSDRSALTHCHTAISLPSPESAYSTGYSTDGTSPGATAPPEYYINIRTGKHYFPSPAPTPTSPHPHTAFPPHSLPRPRHHLPSPDSLAPRPPAPPTHSQPRNAPLPLPLPPHLHPPAFFHSPPKKTSPRTPSTSLKLFLKSPRLTPKPNAANKPLSPSKPKRWFRQPFHKFAHRRLDPAPDTALTNPTTTTTTHPPSLLPPQDAAASPRQRNRIKTNPWLPTAPVSSRIPHPAFPPLPRNRSCTNTPLQHRKSNHLHSPPPPPPPPPQRLHFPSSPAPTPPFDPYDRSDEDLTLNEVMGTYNESYVYEKETDILSDSDPTDCDDYDTDSDADNAGDERDSHDDELDFIDNASLTDSDDGFPPNTGRCTYHHPPANNYPFLSNPDRRHSRKDSDHRRTRERRRPSGKPCPKSHDHHPQHPPKKPPADDYVGGLNLRKLLLQRLMANTASRGPAPAAHRGRPHPPPRPDPTSGVPPLLLDEEADERYNQLMQQADNMFHSLRNSPLLNTRSIARPLHPNDPATPPRKTVKSLALTLPVDAPKKPPNKNSFKARSSAHSPLDPLGPTLRNFAVFHPTRTTSSDDSDPPDASPPKTNPPIAFQSLVLGTPIASYCPQSEPVKRKIFSCSETYDRLVKHLEHTPPLFEDIQPTPKQRPSP